MTPRDADNSKAGIERRARHAGDTIRAEAHVLASEVGADMALCALVGVAAEFAKESGISKDRFVALLVDLLHRVMHGRLK